MSERSAGFLQRARWLLGRLRSMPPQEIPHRVRERFRMAQDARGWTRDRLDSLDDTLRERPPPAWPVDEDRLRAALTGERAARLADDVARLVRGEVTLLGVPWPHGSRTAWDVDPVQGVPWPDAPAHGIDFRHGHRELDIKLAWELHRLQHLQVLALGARLLDHAEARAACLEDLRDWLGSVRPYRGIAWAAGIECASRVISLLVVTGLLGPDTLPVELRRGLWDTLHAHRAWIARYPSLYSSANNHRIAELGALAALAALAPELPGAGWRDLATALASETRRQILPDGVGAEQSPTYQAYTMEWLLAVRAVARHAGRRVHLGERLEAGATFLAHLADADGHVPRIGDDDEGRVLRPALHAPGYVGSVAAATAGCLGVPIPGVEPGICDLRGALLGVQPVPAPRQARRSRTFPQGGYTVLRDPLRERGGLLVFDHGPLGFAWTAAHGHADALSLWLHLGGRPVLIDSGTFRYNGAPAWRRWARGTAAHNTVVVDGRDQSEPRGPFNWASRARVRLLEADLEAGEVHAEHDGYVKLGVVHRRSVRVDGEAFVVTDHLVGEGTHRVVASWHLASDLRLKRVEGERWMASRDDTPVLEIVAPPRLKARIVRGGVAPGPGWASPGYNRVEEAPCLRLEGDVAAPVSFVTRLRAC